MADLFEILNTRAMVRTYSKTPIKKVEKMKILEASIRAPTAAGSEQWLFVTVESEDKRDKLYELLIQAQKVYYSEMLRKPLPKEKMDKWVRGAKTGLFKAPFYVMVFVDMRERFCTRPELEELWAHQSAAAAIENMLLAGWGQGIGGCWYGVPLLMDEGFYEVAGIKRKNMLLAAVLGFGYPKDKISPRQRRKSIGKVLLSA